MKVKKQCWPLRENRNAGEFVDVKKVIREVTDRLNKLQSIDGNISGIRTNFRDLDKITSGLQKGDLIHFSGTSSNWGKQLLP